MVVLTTLSIHFQEGWGETMAYGLVKRGERFYCDQTFPKLVSSETKLGIELHASIVRVFHETRAKKISLNEVPGDVLKLVRNQLLFVCGIINTFRLGEP